MKKNKLIKSIKKTGTIATVGIMLAGVFWMGYTVTNQKTDAQAATEPIKTIQQEKIYPEQRVMSGNYYDYLVIETVDGNEWLLDDSPGSKYIENSIAVFEDGELVQVVFDTKGTKTVMDDEIVEVRSIGRRCLR